MKNRLVMPGLDMTFGRESMRGMAQPMERK